VKEQRDATHEQSLAADRRKRGRAGRVACGATGQAMDLLADVEVVAAVLAVTSHEPGPCDPGYCCGEGRSFDRPPAATGASAERAALIAELLLVSGLVLGCEVGDRSRLLERTQLRQISSVSVAVSASRTR
jgi:hypothetical protein